MNKVSEDCNDALAQCKRGHLNLEDVCETMFRRPASKTWVHPSESCFQTYTIYIIFSSANLTWTWMSGCRLGPGKDPCQCVLEEHNCINKQERPTIQIYGAVYTSSTCPIPKIPQNCYRGSAHSTLRRYNSKL